MEVDELTVGLRITLAALFAGVLGFEREWRGQNAGFRTHILVSIGSCLFTLIGAYGFLPDEHTDTTAMSVDTTRIPSQIIVGIGFLGGGAILRYGAQVRGLTTAANLWLAAGVGMGVGVGYYFGAACAVVVALVALAGLRPLERRVFPGSGMDDAPVEREPPPRGRPQEQTP